MFDSLRNHAHLSRPETDVPVAHLNRHPAFQNEKEVVRVVMFVPHEFALQFGDHDVVPIELTNSSWLPMLRERREAFRQIDSLHITGPFSHSCRGENVTQFGRQPGREMPSSAIIASR